MSEEKISYGILGTGMIADWLASAFRDCRKSELVAVGSRSVDRAKEFAGQHDVAKSYGSYEALLADDDTSAVIIALPSSMHCEWTIRAAEAGKHVLCEKPLAMSTAECDRMAEACQEHNVLLMEAAMYRFQPQMAKVRELIDTGRIGNVRLVRGAFCFPFHDLDNIRLKPAMGGGCLLDIGFYPIDFALFVAGESPEMVSCFAEFGEQSKVEEVAAGCLHFPSGVTALFECGFRVDTRTNADILGEGGTIQLPDPWTARGKKKEVLLLKSREIVKRIELPDPNSYTIEIDHFSECILENKQPILTVAGSRATAATLEALAVSARERNPRLYANSGE